MNNILTQNDGNNQLGIGSSQINLVGVANDSFDITQGTTSFMSFSTVDGSRKISVKKPINLNNNLLTIKSTAKIDSAPTNSLFYIGDNNELKTLGIGTTDEYLRMGFNRPAWGPKTFVETSISGIGNIGYLQELKIDDNKLIGIGSVLGVTDSSISNIIKYDTNNDTSLVMSNGVGIGTLTIKTKYDTNFFDITLKKVDSDFSSNPTSKSLEIVDAKTYKYTITDLGNNSIHYYNLNISDINSFTTSTKKFHHITLRRDSTGPIVASFTISGSPIGIGSSGTVYLQFDTPVQNFATNDITAQNGTISLTNPSADKITWIGSFTPTSNIEDSTNILTLSDTYEDLAGNKGVTATTNNYIVDTINPTATISYSSNGPYKDGTSITITANFNNEMKTNPVPQISISAPESLSATNMTRVSATQYTYSYTVSTSSGNGTCTISLSNGTDLAGNSITTTPTSGSTFIVDNTAPSFSQGSYSFSISNNTSSSSVGSVSATDTHSITYSIVPSSDIFAINSSTGVITLKINCSDNNYSLTVRASDPAGNTTDVNISVKVDTTGPSFSTTSFSISTGVTEVGNVIATDPSPTSNPITYTNVGGTDSSKFLITSEGVLSLKSSEHPVGTYTVTIRATDALNNHSDQSISVTLINPFGTNWEKITDIGFSSTPDPIGKTHTSSGTNSTTSTKHYMTTSMNWASWVSSSTKEYVMIDFEFKHNGTGGYQMLFQIGGSGSSAKDISPQWSVVFNASNANWLRPATKKINISGNSMTVAHQAWVAGSGVPAWVSKTTSSSDGIIASGTAEGNRPGAGIESYTTFNNNTTYKIKVIWEARLPAAYTQGLANPTHARGSSTYPNGLDTTEMYLYVHDGTGYKLDTFSPYYAQSWSYGLGAHYPPARGWGSSDHSARSVVGLGPNAASSNFSIGYINGGSSSYHLKSGTTVKPLQFCKIKKKSGGTYSPGSSYF
jgi:hypothetical protein